VRSLDNGPPSRFLGPAVSRSTQIRRSSFAALALGALAVVAAAAWLLLGGSPPKAADTATRFLAAWTRGDDRGAAGLADPARAAAADLAANRRGLDGATVRATLGDVSEDGDDARAAFHVTWQVPGIGPFEYDSAMRLRRSDDEWRVVWSPKVVHPRLGPHLRLGTTREAARRGPILDRDGRALVRDREIYRVGLQRDKVKNVRASVAALADVVDVDRSALTRAVRGAGPQQFVDAITLRPADYERVKEALKDVPGALAVGGEAPLAESRGFARALLGTVGPVTAEQLDKLGGSRAPGDQVGQSGLQARYEERLGGTAETRVVIRRDGVPEVTLLRNAGRDGRPLRTTLSTGVQRAAEDALGDREDEAALVALQPSTGAILAVANRPADSSYDRALEGRYPPGSTFKVITTAALLARGLRPTETVDCPKTIAVGGRSFKNFEGGAAGAVPFSQDFAQSCNTAFVSLTSRLPASALGDTARDFGLGESIELGMPAAEAQVPPGKDLVARAAAMIGQNETLASPLGMAGVAATVAAGRWHAPRLLAGDDKRAVAPLDPGIRDTLRELMRAVVTQGTGTALAGVPGDVHGKSGTAEHGGGDPPPTHAWFIAYRDDVALAVLVENGRSGGSVAAPIAARFFAACDAESAC
jgi:cell division protein FtsI/penicillin-binding protein 2